MSVYATCKFLNNCRENETSHSEVRLRALAKELSSGLAAMLEGRGSY
jgi:hypothetical protein